MKGKQLIIPVLLLSVLIGVVGYFSLSYARDGRSVRFQSEVVYLNVFEENEKLYLEIEGYYYFTNDSNRSQSLMIGFPVPSDIGPIMDDSIKVVSFHDDKTKDWEDKSTYKQIDNVFIKIRNSFNYRFAFPAEKISIMGCRYVHELKGDEIGYVVTSTQTWGEALDKAKFIIKLPEGYTLKSSNIDFKPVEGKERVWEYNTTDFYPKEDIRGVIEKEKKKN
jgi:hypothetical protein